MAPTFNSGKSFYFSVTDTAGSEINLSSGLSDCSFDRTLDTPEVTASGDNDRAYVVGLRTATNSASGHFASTYAEKLDGLIGNSTKPTWVFGPEGNGSGSRKYTGVGIVNALSYAATVDGKIDMNLGLQCDLAVTSTTFA